MGVVLGAQKQATESRLTLCAEVTPRPLPSIFFSSPGCILGTCVASSVAVETDFNTKQQQHLKQLLPFTNARFEPIRESQISRAMTTRYFKGLHEHAEVGGSMGMGK